MAELSRQVVEDYVAEMRILWIYYVSIYYVSILHTLCKSRRLTGQVYLLGGLKGYTVYHHTCHGERGPTLQKCFMVVVLCWPVVMVRHAIVEMASLIGMRMIQ